MPDQSFSPPSHRSSWNWFLILSAALLACGGGSIARQASAEPRQLAWAPRPALDEEQTWTDASSMESWTANDCGSCHKPDRLFSHPVNVIPKSTVAANLPLERGRIVCTTCHESSAEAHRLARAEHTPMLRNSADAQGLCVQCHQAGSTDRASQHGLAVGRAHLRWPKSSGRTASSSAVSSLASMTSTRTLDDGSRTCVGCHDGLISADIAIGAHGPFQARAEHPVGVRYTELGVSGGTTFSLRPRTALDARLQLVDDQIACTTCHSPFSQERKLLVISNDRSRLCLSCHQE